MSGYAEGETSSY